ncbi:RNA-directed DNA polymerase [Tanacetum coccineum]
MKIDIPDFEGKSHPGKFIYWLHTVERVFDIKNLSDEQKVKLVAIKLKKNASIWWEHVIKQRTQEGKAKIVNWSKMKKKLMVKNLPVQYRQEAFIDYHNYKQTSISVEEFTSEFDHLRLRCDVVEEDEETIARYLAALKPEISDVVQLQQYWSYNDVCRLARKVESQLKKKGNTTNSCFLSRFTGTNTGKKVASSSSNPTRNSSTTSTYNPNSSRGGISTSKRCYKCLGLGHFANDYPNKKMVTFVEENDGPVFDEYDDDHEKMTSDQEEITYADTGELLVIKRTMSAVVKQDESWLRHNIFHTRCTCEGKICNVIIDGGSCENVVSDTMVSKLGLKTEHHPHPYTLSWFRKGNEVKVSKRCLVKFSIGKKYKDEVWCDVVPMDACHILLGRPWQFDLKTKHDGFKNTYTFQKDGVTVILGPSDLRKETKNQLLSQVEFMAEIPESFDVFALVVVESNQEDFHVPSQVISILEEFADVVPQELPSGLPPMRDIQHCIDFVLGAKLPTE